MTAQAWPRATDCVQSPVRTWTRDVASETLLDRLRARVAELRSEPRAFELPDEVKMGLDAILVDVEARRPGT
jgi:hypothetical protein